MFHVERCRALWSTRPYGSEFVESQRASSKRIPVPSTVSAARQPENCSTISAKHSSNSLPGFPWQVLHVEHLRSRRPRRLVRIQPLPSAIPRRDASWSAKGAQSSDPNGAIVSRGTFETRLLTYWRERPCHLAVANLAAQKSWQNGGPTTSSLTVRVKVPIFKAQVFHVEQWLASAPQWAIVLRLQVFHRPTNRST